MAYKPKQVGDAAGISVWDAHVSKAASSPVQAREYKRSSYELESDKVMANRIRNGDVIGEPYLKGETKKRLKKYQHLTEEDFIKYGKQE
tara:strand:+ start:229 stop:495 length:267 start_codon:yes stop_codon:yes gene_type:complete